MYMKKYMLKIALLHGFFIRNYNSLYEQMIAIGQWWSSVTRGNIKIKYISNPFQINFKNKVKFKSNLNYKIFVLEIKFKTKSVSNCFYLFFQFFIILKNLQMIILGHHRRMLFCSKFSKVDKCFWGAVYMRDGAGQKSGSGW